MRRLWFSVVGVIAVAAIVIGINMFADARLANVQLDLTQSSIYTLSPGTRQILAGPEGADHAAAVLFAAARQHACRPTAPMPTACARCCSEYAAVSHGKVQAGILRPRAVQRHRGPRHGLRPARRADRSGRHPGLFRPRRHQPAGRRAHHAFFQPERERFLEYDLTKLVYELSNPKRPVVGVMSSLPLDGDPRMMMMTHGQGRAASPCVLDRCCARPTR